MKPLHKAGMAAHICNLSTQKVKAEGSEVQDQFGYMVSFK